MSNIKEINMNCKKNRISEQIFNKSQIKKIKYNKEK